MSERISDLVAELNAILNEIDWLGRKPRPALRDPATDAQIAELQKKLGRPVPPSYEAFLRICNGMSGAEQYDWAVAGVDAPPTGESFEDVKSGHMYAFKQKAEDHPVLQDLPKSVIVGTDFDYEAVYFDPESFELEEPKLRRIGVNVPYDHHPLFASFEEFLTFVVAGYQDLLAFQNEPMDSGGGGDYGDDDEKLLMELAALLDTAGAGASEPEPEPELSPEMKKAARLCSIALQKLLDRDLVELVEAPQIRENLEDYMLRKLMRARSPDETMDAWIYALSKAREVEELWGTDEELKAEMVKAFEQIAEE